MSEERPDDAEPTSRGRSWGGCLLWAAAVPIAALAVALLLTLIGSWLDDTDNPDRMLQLNVGPAAEYALSDVNYFDVDHVYLVRFADGSFRAFYDRSPEQQERNIECRVRYDEQRAIVGLDQLEGFEGSFFEVCNEQTTNWRVDGMLASGSGYGNLDEFATAIDGNGDLIIDISTRTCTRSRGVVGFPPFDETTCGPPD